MNNKVVTVNAVKLFAIYTKKGIDKLCRTKTTAIRLLTWSGVGEHQPEDYSEELDCFEINNKLYVPLSKIGLNLESATPTDLEQEEIINTRNNIISRMLCAGFSENEIALIIKKGNK